MFQLADLGPIRTFRFRRFGPISNVHPTTAATRGEGYIPQHLQPLTKVSSLVCAYFSLDQNTAQSIAWLLRNKKYRYEVVERGRVAYPFVDRASLPSAIKQVQFHSKLLEFVTLDTSPESLDNLKIGKSFSKLSLRKIKRDKFLESYLSSKHLASPTEVWRLKRKVGEGHDDYGYDYILGAKLAGGLRYQWIQKPIQDKEPYQILTFKTKPNVQD